MKTAIRKIVYGLITGALLLLPGTAFAQIDFYEDFAGDTNRWLTQDFETTDVAVCGNDVSFRANPVNHMDVTVPVEMVSQRIGISNGERAILSYNYKLLYYNDVLPYLPLTNEDWGMVTLAYGPTINGPWTQIDAITPLDFAASDECTARTVAFTPPDGSEVYLRLFADAGTSPEVSYFVYIDDISVRQETLSVSTAVAPIVQVYPNPVTDFINLEYKGNLTDVAMFNLQGQEVPLDDIYRNMNRIDMSALPYGDYVLKLTIDNRLETVDITKK